MSRPCPGTATPSIVEIQRDGDINLVPCSGRTVQVNGITTASAFTVSGSSLTNFFPIFSTETNFTKSPFSFSESFGTESYSFNNTAGNATFNMFFNPSASDSGLLAVGDCTSAPLTCLEIDEGSDFVNLTGGLRTKLSLSENAGGVTSLGDVTSGGNGTNLTITDSSSGFNFANTANTGRFGLTSIRDYLVQRTVTAAATVGDQAINKPFGTVNFAAGAGTSGITVTNSTVGATSIVFATVRTNDATCTVKNVVPAAGSFVIRMTANCTAETSVGFFVTN